MNRANRRVKILIIAIIGILLAIPIIVFPLASVLAYNSIFGVRYETLAWRRFDVDDYEGLQMEREDFESDGITLAGYKYYKSVKGIKGVVVVAHGLGGGGHNAYMPFVDYFTSNGYYVFAYDVRGNDNSGGKTVEGLPQGIVDLDNAINHAATLEEYANLPVMLFGHSWGGYSVGNVLNIHPEVKAAVIVAGFNESEDLLLYQGKQMVGKWADILVPYLGQYERFKFGKKYADISAIEGMEKTDAKVMIVHSKDDGTVPAEYGHDKFYDAFSDNDRIEFVLYEDKGHDYLFYSDDAWEYRDKINADYKSYVEENGKEYNAETKSAFMTTNLDKTKCFEPDPALMDRITSMFDNSCY